MADTFERDMSNSQSSYLIVTVGCLGVCRSGRFGNRFLLFARIHPLPLCQRQELLKLGFGYKPFTLAMR